MSRPSTFIDELLSRVDIVALINRYLPSPLKKSGRSYMACCPFHDEKTPSFSVSPDKGLYYCFGCHASGNAIKFLTEHQRLTFTEAVEVLAQQTGMEIPRRTTRATPETQKRFEQMHAIMGKVSEFYSTQLRRSARVARYLEQRGITQEIAADFAIGYAPATPHLRQCFGPAYNEDGLRRVGLIASSKGSFYEKFRDRLMFPIRNRRGNVIAFGGRLLSDRENPPKGSQSQSPKYMNSPETPIFKKRNTLYGVHELKAAHHLDHLLFVEGYMDVVSLARHGLRNAVASLGTAASQTHIRLALRFSPNLIFCFDGDNPGRLAAVEAAKQALPALSDGCSVALIFLPKNEDPDSYIKRYGYQEFNEQIQQATPLADFLFAHHARGLELSNPAHATRYIKTLRPLIKQLPQGVFQELMFRRLAERAHIDVDTLKTDYEIIRSRTQNKRKNSLPKEILYSAITVALRLLLAEPSLAQCQYALSAATIRTLQKTDAELLADVIERIQHKQLSSAAAIIADFHESPHQDHLSRLFATYDPLTMAAGEAEFKDTMHQLKIEITKQKIEQLQNQSLSNTTAQMELNNLLKQLFQLRKK